MAEDPAARARAILEATINNINQFGSVSTKNAVEVAQASALIGVGYALLEIAEQLKGPDVEIDPDRGVLTSSLCRKGNHGSCHTLYGGVGWCECSCHDAPKRVEE